jgi:hypothetical protein
VHILPSHTHALCAPLALRVHSTQLSMYPTKRRAYTLGFATDAAVEKCLSIFAVPSSFLRKSYSRRGRSGKVRACTHGAAAEAPGSARSVGL